MNDVATSSSFCISPLKRARTTSCNDSDSGAKRPKYYYVLAPESSMEDSSAGEESIYSVQNHSTDWVKDTSDTCTKSSDNMLELDIFSMSDEDVYPFGTKDSSSSPEDLKTNLITVENSISSDGCDNSPDSEYGGKDCRKQYIFKTCVQCGLANKNHFYRFCDKCYKIRKNFFPPRPRKKRTAIKQDKVTYDEGRKLLSSDSGIGRSQTDRSSEEVEGGEFPERRRTDNTCATCLTRPKDGGYIHGKIVHIYSCYRCSSKIVKEIGRCPICNLRVRQVCRVIML